MTDFRSVVRGLTMGDLIAAFVYWLAAGYVSAFFYSIVFGKYNPVAFWAAVGTGVAAAVLGTYYRLRIQDNEKAKR